MPDLALYRPAEEWVDKHRTMLEAAHAGEYLYMNARTLEYMTAPTYKEASIAFYDKFGPIPFEGWTILGIQLGGATHES